MKIPFLKRNYLIYLFASLFLVNLIFLAYFFISSPKETKPLTNFKIIFLDVGQGDATLIKTPLGKNILIDGGPDRGIIYKLDQYLDFYKRKIDLMILTHPDPDHLNGLVEVLKRYRVGEVFYNGVNDESLTYKEFLRLVKEKEIKNEIVWLGKKIIVDGGQIIFLYPFESLANQNLKNDNEGSLVFAFSYGQTKILFTGDATKRVEEKLKEKDINLKADILKVAHHGSKDSSGLEFLEKVKPIYAIISVGKNKFGHPSLRVLKNLEKINSKILRTDQLGDIIFETDGEKLEFKNLK